MIELYTLPGCKGCEQIRTYLEEHKIIFVEYNLKDPSNRVARQSWRELGLNTAPVVVCRNKGGESIFTTLDKKAKDFLLKFRD
jgi:glutaredoxin